MKKLFSILILVFTFLSCIKDDTINSNYSKKFKYEISGNYTGGYTIVYYSSDGTTTTEENNSLPWNKEITYENEVKGISINVSPTVGKPGAGGQNITLTIYRGGELFKKINATVTSNSFFSISSGSIAL